MTATATAKPTVEEAYEAFMAIGRTFAQNPSPAAALQCAEARLRFHVALNGTSAGAAEVLDDLWTKMNRRMKEAKAG